MPALQAIPRAIQRTESWANGAGTTTLVMREPDDADWTVRISVAKVEHDGPFSELPGTRRVLVPLDASMTLRFQDGNQLGCARFGSLHFDGSPAPMGILPEGPTRDFNLMLRGDMRGEVLSRTLVDAMVLLPEPGLRWLVYLDSGHALLRAGPGKTLILNPQDAALVIPGGTAARTLVEGAGEIVLVKLYA
jgi:environmental stress-induced protein Ves